MAAKFLKITSLDHLDELFERSKTAPVVLFKHSNRCGISSHLMETVGQIDADIHFVVVQENRAISDAIAERTGYRHHTPQAFVIREGKPEYHATHYGINAQELEEISKGE